MRFRKLEARARKPLPAAERATNEQRRRSHKLTVYALLLLLLCASVVAYWFWQQRWILTQGRIVTDAVAIAPTLAGRIAALEVTAGERVESGQLLARLEHREHEAELAAARIERDAIRRRLDLTRQIGLAPEFAARTEDRKGERGGFEAERSGAQAQLGLVEAELSAARDVRMRFEALLAARAATRLELEQARAVEQQLQARRAGLQAVLSKAQQDIATAGHLIGAAETEHQRQMQTFAEEIEQLTLAVAQADEGVERLQARVDATVIEAPVAGVVGAVFRVPGEVVAAGETLLNLVQPDARRIVAYVEASDLAHVRPGKAVEVRIDGLENAWHQGTIVDYGSRFDDLASGPRIGTDSLRTPRRLGQLVHPVEIRLSGAWPQGSTAEMTVSVRIPKER